MTRTPMACLLHAKFHEILESLADLNMFFSSDSSRKQIFKDILGNFSYFIIELLLQLLR